MFAAGFINLNRDFAEFLGENDPDTGFRYKLSKFAASTAGVPPEPETFDPELDEDQTYRYTFSYYILNRNAYESSQKRTVIPQRKDSFLLITPGKDKIYGTADDVTNFE